MEKLSLADSVVVFSALVLAGTSIFLLSRLDFGQKHINKSETKAPLTQMKKLDKPKPKTISKNRIPSTTTPSNNISDSDHQYKGYKTTADGKIRTYFHRDITPEDKQLIGDYSPKPIIIGNNNINNSNSASSSSSSSSSSSNLMTPRSISNKSSSSSQSSSSQSQWNSSGTWEERDHSKWAKDRLLEVLGSATYTFPSKQGDVSVSSVTSIEGDASVILIRGKRKFIYDFTIELTWMARISSESNGTVSGKFTISEVTSDCMYDIKSSIPSYDMTWSDRSRKLIDDYILSANKGIKKVIVDALNDFLKDFQALYGINNGN